VIVKYFEVIVAGKPASKLMIFGDSQMEGPTLGANYTNAVSRQIRTAIDAIHGSGSCIISARGGDESTNMLSRLEWNLMLFRPQYVMLAPGTNDGNTATWTANLLKMIDICRRQGAIPIVPKVLPYGVIASYTGLVAGSGGTNGTYAAIFTGGGGTGMAATITVAGGVVTGIAWTAAGSGYATPPTISFANCTGLTGASATIVLGPDQAIKNTMNAAIDALTLGADVQTTNWHYCVTVGNDGFTIDTARYDGDLIHIINAAHNDLFAQTQIDLPFLFY